jgi:hypothetical protein
MTGDLDRSPRTRTENENAVDGPNYDTRTKEPKQKWVN